MFFLSAVKDYTTFTENNVAVSVVLCPYKVPFRNLYNCCWINAIQR